MNFELNSFGKNIICENAAVDTAVETVISGDNLELFVTAKTIK